MEQTIIGFSGRKQSGKNTCANYILGTELWMLRVVQGEYAIKPSTGELWVSDIYGKTDAQGIFNINSRNKEVINFLEEEVYPYIKLYSFADLLKQNVCMDVLGLSYEHCYGTDEQKNSLTHLKWEDMPGVVSPNVVEDAFYRFNVDASTVEEKDFPKLYSNITGQIIHEPGYMTAREVMEFVGTEVFRKMHSRVWADSTINRIKSEGSLLAIITDCRFPDEVEVIQNAGGSVIRLTRNPHNGTHAAETSLDPDKFDWNKFNYVLDNKEMNIVQQNEAINRILVELNVIPGAV